MNPNLQIFFKRAIYLFVSAGLLVAMFYSITELTSIDFAAIGSYIAYGFLGFIVAGMFVLIIGFIMRSVWTGIMNRADSIDLCCPDQNHGGTHLIVRHYQPGGESDGYDSYLHYYIDNQGKSFLSKKILDEGKDINESLQDLCKKTGKHLEPDHGSAIRVGSNTDGDDAPKNMTIRLNDGELHFKGYSGLLDYGFKLTFNEGNQTKWRMRI